MSTKKYLPLITTIVLIVLVLTLTGCVQENKDDLRGTTWVLTEINGMQPLSRNIPTIEFVDERISGSAGCNHFGGDYEVNRDNLNFISLHNTEMYCMEPEGIMDQEQVYLETLSNAVSFSLAEEELVVFGDGGRYLVFELNNIGVADISSGDNNETVQIEALTEAPADDSPNKPEPPWEYNQYQDAETGIGILIPETWIVTGIVEGRNAILQSYPEDKYVGGELLEDGDTKCDLTIQSLEVSLDELIDQLKSSPMTEIISEEEFLLHSGETGFRYELSSMGMSTVMVVEIDERVVVFACFGNREYFDEIAMTIN